MIFGNSLNTTGRPARFTALGFNGQSLLKLLLVVSCSLFADRITLAETKTLAGTNGPCIINIYNFVRDNDFRVRNSERVLFEATVRQVQLIKRANLPATFALQYDALMDTNYQRLFKEQLPRNCEIAAWWEIPGELAEKANLKWRGDHEWDPQANVGFSPGYTPAERRRLVDAYMSDFKAIFGFYPRTVGSWYIDEVTLDYMAKRYGIVASCNCKDQIGTDFYTLWGGYWNQAYYPSRLDAYMPAQTRAGQIDVPIFRMLGSDPIYQHGITPGMFTLEPVYGNAGGSTNWVMSFMDNLIEQPSLAFAYTQAGQENSFGWDAMGRGLTQQIKLIARLKQEGKVEVKTLAQAGQWFRDRYSLTPPTAVVAMDDWKHEGRKTVWYDSRFYRMNILWQNGTFFIRDFHCFDENVISPTHDSALTATSLSYQTLPIMDWALWSRSESRPVGMWPILLSPDGAASPMMPQGPPAIKELTATVLRIKQPLEGGGVFSIICSENHVSFSGLDQQGLPLRWAWRLVGGPKQEAIVRTVRADQIAYRYIGTDYQVRLISNSGACEQLTNGDLQINANASGRLDIESGPAPAEANETTHTAALVGRE